MSSKCHHKSSEQPKSFAYNKHNFLVGIFALSTAHTLLKERMSR